VTRLVAVALALVLSPQVGSAQELEPGAYWPLPRGLNVLTAVEGVNWGDLNFDPTVPVENASATISTTVFGFTRAISFAGRSANFGALLPISAGHVEGLYRGEFTEVDRFGQGDPRFKLSVNVFGAPVMTPKEFASYRQKLLVGLSLAVAPPLGQYDNTKVINLGTNRWSFKPEIGLSRTSGKWVVEFMAGVWLFTDNTDFVGNRTREQDPILATQVHVTHRFTPGMWLAANANFYTGGRTTVGGQQNIDLQRNSRIGATFSKALTRRQSVRVSISRGAYTTIGAAFNAVAVGYNFAWLQ
jgi:hypothetical protein